MKSSPRVSYHCHKRWLVEYRKPTVHESKIPVAEISTLLVRRQSRWGLLRGPTENQLLEGFERSHRGSLVGFIRQKVFEVKFHAKKGQGCSVDGTEPFASRGNPEIVITHTIGAKLWQARASGSFFGAGILIQEAGQCVSTRRSASASMME